MRPVALAIAAVSASCLAPTEVTIELTSDACGSLDEIEILLDATPDGGGGGNGDAPVAQTNVKCQGNRIGSLVFIPSERGGDRFTAFPRITVRARAKGKSSGATCTGPATNDCIQASRSVSFVKHTPLTLPIALDAACRDRACQPGSTCMDGDCVPNDVSNQCANGVCRPPLPDAGGCPHPWWNQPGANALHWTFDGAMVSDQLGRCGTTAIQTTPSMASCNTAFVNNGLGASVGCPNDAVASAASFHVAFWLRVPASISSPLFPVQKVRNTTMSNGWAVMLRGMNEMVFNGIVNGAAQASVLATGLSADWHAVEIVVQGGMLAAAWLDQKKLAVTPIPVGDSVNGNVILGPLGAGALDELWIY